jgi:hypothetical protein
LLCCAIFVTCDVSRVFSRRFGDCVTCAAACMRFSGTGSSLLIVLHNLPCHFR